MKPQEIFKELIRYGSIIENEEDKRGSDFYRTIIFIYEGYLYNVFLKNGEVISLDIKTFIKRR